MSYTITNNCISCNRCLNQCPTHAIYREGLHYWIERNRCNQCAEFYRVPQCAAVCPTNGGVVKVGSLISGLSDKVSVNPRQRLLPEPGMGKPAGSDFSRTLTASLTGDYWDSWFHLYNRLVTQMNAAKNTQYWQQWFNTYSQVLALQIQRQQHQALIAEA